MRRQLLLQFSEGLSRLCLLSGDVPRDAQSQKNNERRYCEKVPHHTKILTASDASASANARKRRMFHAESPAILKTPRMTPQVPSIHHASAVVTCTFAAIRGMPINNTATFPRKIIAAEKRYPCSLMSV